MLKLKLPSRPLVASATLKPREKIMLFDLSLGGHHPGYILHLIQYWLKHNIPGVMEIVVLPQFMEQHSDVVAAAVADTQQRVRFVPITATEAASLSNRSTLLSRKKLGFQEWNLLCKYAASLGASHALLMYFDTYQLPSLLGKRPPCGVSGIYFRPRFHYAKFDCQNPWMQQRWQQWREKFFLSLVLRNSQWRNLFCLDPLVVPEINNFQTASTPLYLPDPVKIYHDRAVPSKQLRENLGIEPQRRVFLLFGALHRRKGIYKLLDAIKLLPANVCQECCFLLVGPIAQGDSEPVQQKIEQLRESLPVQIVTHNQFIHEREVQSYFQIADVILAPYQRHVGMSAILVRAAAAGKAVLASDYGLMGEITRSHHLGITVDTEVTEQIAQGLRLFCHNAPQQLCDSSKMQAFARQNSADKFAEVIVQQLNLVRS